MTQYAHFDDDGVTIETVGNTDAVLEQNARMRAVHTQAPKGDQTWGNHVASIPMGLYEQFCRENPELRQGTDEALAWLLAKINSREYCHLKTFDGRA